MLGELFLLWHLRNWGVLEVQSSLITSYMKSNILSLDTPVGRRQFLKRSGIALTSLTLAGALSELLSSCASLTGPTVTHGTTTIDISSLTSDGQYFEDKSVQPDGTPILVIRQNASSYIALSMLCTHAGCQVSSPSGGIIYCTCHGSEFDYHGNVLRGPASSPLTNYSVVLNAAATTIIVTY
jgi:Rieske Fe-S protein